jgi:DNA-binding CsgD family transcriptional regulator
MGESNRGDFDTPGSNPAGFGLIESLTSNRQSPAFLSQIVDDLPHGTIRILDGDLRRIFVAGKGFAEAGIDPASLLGRTLHDSPPSDASLQDVLPVFEKAFAGMAVDFAYFLGGNQYVMSASPFELRGSQPLSIIVFGHNVTKYADAVNGPDVIRFSTLKPETREPLSKREEDVLLLMTHGLTNKEMALTLQVGVSTINKHVSHVLTKLAASSRTEASVRAVRSNLI